MTRRDALPASGGQDSRAGAHVTQHSTPSAVARVLQLHHETVRIGEVQLRRAGSRPAAVRHAHAHVVHEWSDWPAPTGLETEVGERLQYFVEIEPLHAHARVIDARRARRS